MEKQDLAIFYSGGRNSLLLYALALAGHHPEIFRPHSIHLLHMLNGMGRFHSFPLARYQLACGLLERQIPRPDEAPPTRWLELDMGRLFQGLWLDRCEELMPRFNGKNLVCVACKLGMHVKGLLYCITHHVPLLLVGYGARSSCCSQHSDVFMERVAALSTLFGITTKFPLYGATDEHTVCHLLEEFGLPSTGGGERHCLFSQTLSSAGAKEIDDYLEAMIPLAVAYMEHSLAGRVQVAAACFSPGMRPC
ncbi:MAG: hypothetical protein KJ804_15010 [Proteobacteria bacterium]|nr:hypothetical protein [Pseudomonadota bacterium]MBU1059620.1 hypothetical protein [Pseudomonadota bacterium]